MAKERLNRVKVEIGDKVFVLGILTLLWIGIIFLTSIFN